MKESIKPIGPENIAECSFCGYTDVVSKFDHTCWYGLSLGAILTLLPCSIFMLVIVEIWL